jgi:hypothetical protein
MYEKIGLDFHENNLCPKIVWEGQTKGTMDLKSCANNLSPDITSPVP